MITESTFKGCKSIQLENDYVRVGTYKWIL